MGWEKKATQAEAVKAFLVTIQGKVDLEASVEKFRSVALKTLATQETQDALIVTCMNGIFDAFPGASLNLDYIKSHTVQAMAKQVPELKDPAVFGQVSKRVEEVLHALTDQPEVAATADKPGSPAITNRAFAMRKGKGGGFYRKSDQAAKPA